MTTYTDPFGGDTIPPAEYSYAAYSITANDTLYWPSQYDGSTGLLAAAIVEITATSGLTLTLPPADQVSTGFDILLRNVGANSVIIVDNDGGTVATIAAGEARYVYVVDNSDAAGIWHLFTYGTGTSSADASALAGSGLQANSGKIRVNASYRGLSSSSTLVTTDRGKLLEILNGSLTLTLPLASTVGDGYYTFIHNSAAGSTDIVGNGIDLIDGSSTKTMAPGESAIFICNGTYWLSIGYGRDVEFVFSEFVVNMAAGDVVLTSAQVSGKMIRLSGTAAANLIVTLPSVDNIYFLNVESGLGGFTATFTTGSGSTVALLADQKTVVYSDGTNISSAVTTTVTSSLALNDGDAGSPTLTFALDLDTGLFRNGDGELGVTSNGVAVAIFDANGLNGEVVFVPVGSISSTTVSGALAELDVDIQANTTGLADHITDTTDAHDASAISVVPAGSISSIEVQSALVELDTDIQTNATGLANHLADATGAHAASAIANTPAGDIAATDVQAAIDELDTEKTPRTSTTGSAVLPSGTTAQRDGSPAAGYIRFNGTLTQFEGYNGTTWGSIGGGATGGGSDEVFVENDQVVTTDYTITSGKNAHSVGPITINDGITVTVPDGSVWLIG